MDTEGRLQLFVSKLSIDKLITLLDINKVLSLAVSLGNKDMVLYIIQRWNFISYELINDIIHLIGLRRLRRIQCWTAKEIITTYLSNEIHYNKYPPNINRRIFKQYLNDINWVPGAWKDDLFDKYNLLRYMKKITEKTYNPEYFIEYLLTHNCTIPKNISLTPIHASKIQQMQFEIVNFRMIKKYAISTFKEYERNLKKNSVINS